MAERADCLVIGLGAMGSAALYQLAKRGASVIGLDRFAPPHTMGSSHGETRITRQGIGEGRGAQGGAAGGGRGRASDRARRRGAAGRARRRVALGPRLCACQGNHGFARIDTDRS